MNSRPPAVDGSNEPASGSTRRYRPPIGIPARGDRRREATLLSLALHALVIVLVLAPPIWLSKEINARQQRGPKGDGRSGGGGGGNRGTGGPERLRFFAFPTAQAEDIKKLPDPQPLPVPPPIPKVEPEQPNPPAPPEPVKPTEGEKSGEKDVASLEKGVGGGSGKDGTAGSGPGTGGGVGSGDGTGRGTGTGAGTGGGNDDDEVYPPTVIALTILPIPVPDKVRPYKLVATFEVDTLGNARLLAFNPSKDSGYNRRIREMLSEIRFRPAVKKNGRPVLDTAVVTAEASRS